MNKKRVRKSLSAGLWHTASMIVIIGLCAYISNYCIENIFGINLGKKAMSIGVKTLKNVVGNIDLQKNDVIKYIEEETHLSLSKTVEKKLLEGDIVEVVKKEEKVKKTDAKTVQKKQDKELLKKVYKENKEFIKCTSLELETDKKKEKKEVAEETETKQAQEVFAGKVIVPLPEISGTRYTAKKLVSFDNTINKFYTVASATSISESDLNIEKALKMKFHIEGDASKPQILIYHTHSQERFSDNKAKHSIIQVGEYLAEILREQFGYNVIHDKSTYDLVDGKLDRNVAYEQAREGVSKLLNENPSIDLILDIHRDGVADNVHLVTKVNGKDTAQVMFFNGMSRFKDSGNIDYLYNPYLKENLALSFQMKMNAEAYYPGYARKNYLNAYKYNLDLREKCMLIEVGAQTNTFQEVKNAMEPLAMLINLTMDN